MKKFYFSLEKILSLRIFYEREAEVALQKAVGERDAVRLQIEKIDASLFSTSSLFAQDVDMSNLYQAEQYIKALKARKLQLQAVLITLEGTVRECLQNYHEALKERKVLDRLKDKKMEEWKEECEKEEMFMLDEALSAKIRIGS